MVDTTSNTVCRRLTGKAAVVTGAAQGVGKGIALALAQEGCATAVLSRVSTAGQITSYAAPSREIQLGLKLRMFPTV
jgi:NAD(P)-dependent dehydrogenase (short-subunit alcohol dehydrogenase family)